MTPPLNFWRALCFAALVASLIFATVVYSPSAGATVSPIPWNAPERIDPATGGDMSASCVGGSFCMVVDVTNHFSTYNGTEWSAPQSIAAPKLSQSYRPSPVSCTSTTFCLALLQDGSSATYNGSSWSAPVPSGTFASAVSCTSATFCIAVDDGGNAAKYNGTSWSPLVPVSTNLSSVSCVSTTFCVAVDGETRQAAIYNGSTWSKTVVDSDAASYLNSVSCPSTTFCVATDVGKGTAITYNGSSWSAPVQIDSYPYVWSVSCTSSTFCVAQDEAGGVVVYNGSGWTDREQVLTNDEQNATTLSCGSPTLCVTGGYAQGKVSRYNGTSWSSPVLVDGPGGNISAVSCPTDTFCMAVDMNGNALKFDGTDWSTPVRVDDIGIFGELDSISCPTSSFCVAVDTYGDALTYNAGVWSDPVLIAGPLFSSTRVSCASSTFCVMIEGGDYNVTGEASVFNGVSWTPLATVDPGAPDAGGGELVGISCTSSTFCMAIDYQGGYVTYNGTSWSSFKQADIAFGVGVSCTSSTFCMSASNQGQRSIYNGSGWAEVVHPNHDAGSVGGVGCASNNLCVAVNDDGSATTWDGATASTETLGAASDVLRDVSCASTGFCAIVSSVGDVITGQALPPVGNDSLPQITGTPQVGETLTATPGSWSPSPEAVTYQWLANGAQISGETSSTLNLTSSQHGKKISVRVSATHTGYSTGYSTSAETSAVAAGVIGNTTLPKISGSVKVGSTLTVSNGAWDVTGLTYKYQWLRDGGTIAGATSKTYKLTSASKGHRISAKVVVSRTGYLSASKTTNQTVNVASGTITNWTPPKISGTAKVGSTLSVSAGSWSVSGLTYHYRWYRDGLAISGATAKTYKLTSASRGHRLNCKVTVTRTGYTTASKSSPQTAKVT